jgi:hypothetical protein
MTAYDVGGALLGTISTPFVFNQCNQLLTLEGIGEIASVVWTTSDPFVAGIKVDDLTFTTVPEPASAGRLRGARA